MTLSETELLTELSEKAASALAIEALWDGDTQGWFVDICAVFKLGPEFDSIRLHSLCRGGDIRLFNGQVPTWPEALEAARVGNQLATLLGVPFHFHRPIIPKTTVLIGGRLTRASHARAVAYSSFNDETADGVVSAISVTSRSSARRSRPDGRRRKELRPVAQRVASPPWEPPVVCRDALTAGEVR